MRQKISITLIGLFFIILLIISGILQTHLKGMPQLLMMMFSTLALIAFFSPFNILSTTLFYIVLGILLYFFYFTSICWLINTISPHITYVDEQGHSYPTTDNRWMWSVFLGICLSPITLFIYHKYMHRNKTLEIITTAAYLITTIIIYLTFEIF